MIKLNFIYTTFLFWSLLLITGCSQNDKNVKVNLNATTGSYVFPILSPISAQETQLIKSESESFFDSLLRGSGFNGGMIVAKGGNIIFEKYQGFINMDGKNLVDSTTSLHIASVSKTFTAMAILKLQEQGKLNIDDSLIKYFPNFNYPGVTIKTLLNHRSGLPNYLYFMEDAGWNKDSIIENKDVFQWLITKKDVIKNIGKPDVRFNYCNTNYALLALVIEKITAKSYPIFMQENIFSPLGMKNTFVHFKADKHIRSKSFDWKGREIADNFLDDVYGDKNIYSTPRDLLIWDRALSDTIFLSAKSLNLAYTPYSNERPGIKNYGLGWRMNNYEDGKKIIFHNGWWHGNNAAFIRLLKEDATIILISNRYARAVYKAKNLVNIFNHYFDNDLDDGERLIIPTNP